CTPHISHRHRHGYLPVRWRGIDDVTHELRPITPPAVEIQSPESPKPRPLGSLRGTPPWPDPLPRCSLRGTRPRPTLAPNSRPILCGPGGGLPAQHPPSPRSERGCCVFIHGF